MAINGIIAKDISLLGTSGVSVVSLGMLAFVVLYTVVLGACVVVVVVSSGTVVSSMVASVALVVLCVGLGKGGFGANEKTGNGDGGWGTFIFLPLLSVIVAKTSVFSGM